jgi:hypothetical protein
MLQQFCTIFAKPIKMLQMMLYIQLMRMTGRHTCPVHRGNKLVNSRNDEENHMVHRSNSQIVTRSSTLLVKHLTPNKWYIII